MKDKNGESVAIKVRAIGQEAFQVDIQGDKEILAEAILSTFLDDPELAINFSTTLFSNLQVAIQKKGAFLCVPGKSEKRAAKILSMLANDMELALTLWCGIFQTIANTNEASPAEYVIPEGETIQ